MKNSYYGILLSLILIITFLDTSNADMLYSNDFETSVGAEWSHSNRMQAPYGQKYLGDFSNNLITLNLGEGTIIYEEGLPQHTSITLCFDLYIIRSMDGNDSTYSSTFGSKGPDLWTLDIDNTVLLNTTFANHLRTPSQTPQSFPGEYQDNYPAQTGASAINDLGYNTVSNGYINSVFGDSTYNICFSLDHTDDFIQINFQGSGMQILADEAWGIDNLELTFENNQPPVLIKLASFTVTPDHKQNIINWSTASETDNAGFNIYRSSSENGDYMKINDELIPAEGSPTEGALYEFTDTTVQNRKKYWYKLEDVDMNGTVTVHGPVSAVPRLIYGLGQ